MDQMIVQFGGILRAELVHLMEKPNSSRIRAHSSGSHISIDSSKRQKPIFKFGLTFNSKG